MFLENIETKLDAIESETLNKFQQEYMEAQVRIMRVFTAHEGHLQQKFKEIREMVKSAKVILE